jgi:hypothetical protein
MEMQLKGEVLQSDFLLFRDRLDEYRRYKAQFMKLHGYELNLKVPVSFNEKIIWKKIFDRNPLLTYTTDKYKVRSYVKKTLGLKKAEKILIPLYYVTNDPSDIAFDDLPDKFVIKPNHGSRMHIIVNDNKNHLIDIIKEKCRVWINTNFYYFGNEWAYMDIKRKIIIEKLLEDENSGLPNDYKFFCFHGKCKYILVKVNRFLPNGGIAFYTTKWKMLPVKMRGAKIMKFDKPRDLDEMIFLAESLSVEFDAVRADLYNCEGQIYFGELTHYHGSGMRRFEPASFDFELGQHWKLKPEYWLKY